MARNQILLRVQFVFPVCYDLDQANYEQISERLSIEVQNVKYEQARTGIVELLFKLQTS